MIPQSANVSPMDLNDDINSEDKDLVKSLNSQGKNNRNVGLNQSIGNTSEKSYNFQMEKIDSFMMSSEQSK